ncbi:hypothetical protein ACLOJK_024471 [Asimina triloba]
MNPRRLVSLSLLTSDHWILFPNFKDFVDIHFLPSEFLRPRISVDLLDAATFLAILISFCAFLSSSCLIVWLSVLDYRGNRAVLFDDIEEGGKRATSSYASHEIDEQDNDRAIDGLQDRVNILKRYLTLFFILYLVNAYLAFTCLVKIVNVAGSVQDFEGSSFVITMSKSHCDVEWGKEKM